MHMLYSLAIGTFYLSGISALLCIVAAVFTRGNELWTKAQGLAAASIVAAVVAIVAQSSPMHMLYSLAIATIYLSGVSMLVCVLTALLTRQNSYWIKAKGLALVSVVAAAIAIVAQS